MWCVRHNLLAVEDAGFDELANLMMADTELCGGVAQRNARKVDTVPSSSTRNRSCWWHHPASRSDRAAELLLATQIGCRPDAASFLHMACAAVCDDARRVAPRVPPASPYAAVFWSRCSPTETHAARECARGNASRSSPCDASGIDRASKRSCRPARAGPIPCQPGGR